MVAKGLARQSEAQPMAEGGSPEYTVHPYPVPPPALRQAINHFSKVRNSSWDPQGTAQAMSAWDPNGVAMQQSRRLMQAEPPPAPHPVQSSVPNSAADLGQTIEEGYRAFTPKPAGLVNPSGAPETGNVALTGDKGAGKPYSGTMTPAKRDFLSALSTVKQAIRGQLDSCCSICNSQSSPR